MVSIPTKLTIYPLKFSPLYACTSLVMCACQPNLYHFRAMDNTRIILSIPKQHTVSSLLFSLRRSEAPIEVNTVDSFQGQERDVVVVSLARSHGVGFLTDAGRMNVMLTRAKHALVICLNPHAMLVSALLLTVAVV